ncbi:MAG: peroxiredoxin-like family protein [Salibacteraceae bacterium]
MKSILTILFIGLISQLATAQFAETAEDICPLLIGEKIPNESVKNMSGEEINLTDAFEGKKAILVFYRGGWCPYCNRHLEALQLLEEEAVALGYKIIAVSPDAPNNLEETKNRNNLNYELVSDSNGKLTNAMGLAFKTSERQQKYIDQGSNGENPGYLPVPSLFVVNQESVIEFEYINPNYINRMSGDLLMSVLKSFK